MIYLGGCGCKGIKSNVAIIQSTHFGHDPLNNTPTDITKYLRYDRVIVSGREYLDDYTISVYEGYDIENKYNGDNTKSSENFLQLENMFDTSDQYSNITATSRTWTLPRTYYDSFGNASTVYIVMNETLSLPWRRDEFQEMMYEDLTTDVPWTNPFIFDLEHRITAYFRYNAAGGLILNPNQEINPVVFDDTFKCVGAVMVSMNYLGIDGAGTVSAFMRPFRTRVETRFGGNPPLFNCSNPAAGFAYGDSWIVEAETIILPPSLSQMELMGMEVGQWGHTSTISC